MIHTVTDDTFNGARRIGRKNLRTSRAGWITALALIGGIAAPWPVGMSFNQQAFADFAVNVRETTDDTPRVVVPLNGSVVIETSEPMTRVQSVEPAIARIESITSKQYMVIGLRYGATQLLLWSESGQRQVISVDVELDVRELNKKLAEVDPQSNAIASTIRGNIVLTGTVSGANVAEQMAHLATLFLPGNVDNPEDYVQNHLMVSGQQQVLLRCTVAEVNRNASKKLGISGFLAGDNFQDAFMVSRIGDTNPLSVGIGGGVPVQNTLPFLTESLASPLSTLSLGFPKIQMSLLVDAMADNSLLRVLAEPNLVALSGETASFLAGGEFPIPVPQSGSSSGAVTIEFREFGVRMNFTPVVLAHQQIRLRIAPEVSETDYSNAIQIQGTVVPGLTQRRMETTIEMGNGQTIAVAGLLSSSVSGTANRVPGLGEVPVLGALFRSVEYQKRLTEMVVLVTPEIVSPMDPQQVPKVPGEDYVTPNDYELYALGLLEGEVDAQPEDPSGVYRTNARPKVAPLKSQPEETSLHGPWGYSKAEDLQ